MPRRIYKDGQWSTVEEPAQVNALQAKGIESKAPAALFEDEPDVTTIDTNKMPFERILNDHLIVTVDKYKRPSGNLIKLPKTAQGNSTKGTVLAVADNISDVKVGDKILYSQFAGYLLTFEGFPLLRSLSYSEILAVLKQDAPDIILLGA